MRGCKPWLAASITAFVQLTAQAAEVVVPANLAGSGGTAMAVPEDNASITANPGLLGLEDRYDLHGQIAYGPDGLVRWAASAADARTSKWLDLGFHYSGSKGNPPPVNQELPGWSVVGEEVTNRQQFHQFALAAGGGVLDHRLAFGLGGTLVIYDHEHLGGGSMADLDAGIGIRAAEWLDFGLAGRNLIPLESDDTNLPATERSLVDRGSLLPMTFGVGANLHGKPGALLADGEWRPTEENLPIVVAAGGELPLGAMPRLRAGWRYEGPAEQHQVTAGLGAIDQAGSFDVAARVPVGAGQPTFDGLSFLLSVTLHAPTADDPTGF